MNELLKVWHIDGLNKSLPLAVEEVRLPLPIFVSCVYERFFVVCSTTVNDMQLCVKITGRSMMAQVHPSMILPPKGRSTAMWSLNILQRAPLRRLWFFLPTATISRLKLPYPSHFFSRFRSPARYLPGIRARWRILSVFVPTSNI